MGSRSSHHLFPFCLACFLLLLLSRLPSEVMYTTIFFILFWALSEMGNGGKDKAVDVWRKLEGRIPEGSRPVVKISRLWAKIYSLRQGEQTVKKYFKEFKVVWGKLETNRPLPACTRGAKCSCCKYLQEEREEREKLKVVRFLEGLDGDRFDATRSRIMLEDRLPSLEKAAQMASVAEQNHEGEEVTGIDKIQLDHSIHPCPLTLKPAGVSYTCSGCKQLGFGRRYRCESSKCNAECGVYVLHEDCAKAAVDNNSPVRHKFFKESSFSFLKQPTSKFRICDACRKDVKGFVYHCPSMGTKALNDTGKDLHPCCFKLKDSISEGNVKLKLSKTTRTKCQKCRKVDENNDKGWSYESSNGELCYHVSCFKELY